MHIPIAVIVDLDFVENGPDRQTRAGIGDVISNISALADWELARRGPRRAGRRAGRRRWPGSGAEAVLNHPGDMTDDGFVTVLAEALISSGLAMAVCGTSRPASGGCHEIIARHRHALSRAPRSHGEQAGLGALFCTFLRGDERAVRPDVRTAWPGTGCRALPADVGLTDEQFVEVVEFAPRTRPDRYTILEHLDLTPDEIRRTAGRLRRCRRRPLSQRRHAHRGRLLRGQPRRRAVQRGGQPAPRRARSRSFAHRLGLAPTVLTVANLGLGCLVSVVVVAAAGRWPTADRAGLADRPARAGRLAGGVRAGLRRRPAGPGHRPEQPGRRPGRRAVRRGRADRAGRGAGRDRRGAACRRRRPGCWPRSPAPGWSTWSPR